MTQERGGISVRYAGVYIIQIIDIFAPPPFSQVQRKFPLFPTSTPYIRVFT